MLVCLSTRLRYSRKLWTDFHEMFWVDGVWSTRESIRFWDQSTYGSGYNFSIFQLGCIFRTDENNTAAEIASLPLNSNEGAYCEVTVSKKRCKFEVFCPLFILEVTIQNSTFSNGTYPHPAHVG